MRTPKWRQQTVPAYGDRETWFARYRGWTLYAHLQHGPTETGECYRASLHRFNGGGADMPKCAQVYMSLEGAQNAAEFFAENHGWPHDRVPA